MAESATVWVSAMVYDDWLTRGLVDDVTVVRKHGGRVLVTASVPVIAGLYWDADDQLECHEPDRSTVEALRRFMSAVTETLLHKPV